MTKDTIEGMLTKIALDFDREYFNGIGLVVGVKFARFIWDWKNLRHGLITVTFGMYDSETRVIYVNAFFHKMLLHGLYLDIVKSVIFHELCHGVLINSIQPLRLGQYKHDYTTGGHGPEFQDLEKRYSDYISPEKMNCLGPVVVGWMKSIAHKIKL